MSHYINPKSISSYLSGLCNQLEIYFSEVQAEQNLPLVKKTLAGSKKRFSSPTKRKHAITRDDLLQVINFYQMSSHHDDLLFVALLVTGFYALLRLGEMTLPDDPHLKDNQKLTMSLLVTIEADSYSFFLPTHKADAFFEGNKVLIKKSRHATDLYK